MDSIALLLILLVAWPVYIALSSDQQRPNFVVIFADDMGYGDLQCYGHPTQEKGPLDVMAEEGMRFTHWYSADSLCTPSRAALLTGRLPVRTGMVGPNRVLWQWDSGGLPKTEVTVAESLGEAGYATGMVGKWHLGINQDTVNDGKHLPYYHGFQYVGTNFPYGQNWKCDPEKFTPDEMSVKCFKYKNTTMVQQPTMLESSTREIVDDTKNFLRENAHNPFFFYLPLLQTHSALFCASEFCRKSKRGLYGDNINEMAWAVGEVLKTLKELEIEKNTLVLFLSDHGPQHELCMDGGSSGAFQGGKGSTWEGGLRVPAIAWWPGTIASGVVSQAVVSTLDIFPTLLHLAGLSGSDKTGVVHDGRNILPVLTNEDASSPHEFLYHYCSDRLMAVHYRDLKIHYFTQKNCVNLSELCSYGKPKDDVLTFLDCYGENIDEHDPPLIFNVDEDPGEEYPLCADDFAEDLDIIAAAVTRHRLSIVEVPSQLGRTNEELQPCCDPPTCSCNYNPNGGKYQTEL